VQSATRRAVRPLIVDHLRHARAPTRERKAYAGGLQLSRLGERRTHASQLHEHVHLLA
jgi:hypothetical protein